MKTNVIILLLTMTLLSASSVALAQCNNDTPSDCPTFTLSMSGTQESCERGKLYVYINWSEAISLVGIDMEIEITLNGGAGQSFEFHEVITDESIYAPLTESAWFDYEWDGASKTYTLDGDDGTENLCVDFPSGVTKLMALYFDSDDEVEVQIITGTVAFTILDGNKECNAANPFGTYTLTIPSDGGVVNPNPQTVDLPTALPQVSGTIEHINGDVASPNGMPNVKVVVLPNGGSSVDEITDSDGDYCSPGEEDEYYYLTPEYDQLYLCGINTDDIDAIQAHLLQTNEFDDSDHWQFLAADANQTETISAADMSCLRGLILETDNCDGNFVDWKFVEKNEYELLDNNDGEDVFNIMPAAEEIETDPLEPNDDWDQGDFYGVKMGDVVSTWCDATDDLPTQFTSDDVAVISQIEPFSLIVDKSQLEHFPNKLDFYPSRSIDQLTMMAFSAQVVGASIVNVEFHKKDQSSSMEYVVNNDGVLDFIWFTMAPDQHRWQADTPIFALHFDSPLEDVGQVHLTQNKVVSLMYTVDERYPLLLEEAESVNNRLGTSTTILWPNPSRDMLYVSSTNNERLLAVEIFDMQGRTLHRKEVNSTSTELDISSLIEGTYTVKIEAKNGFRFERFIKH